jgi:hypothetical protein
MSHVSKMLTLTYNQASSVIIKNALDLILNIIHTIIKLLTPGVDEPNIVFTLRENRSISVGKPCTDSVPPTMQSQIPKSRDVILFFRQMTF